MGLKLANFLNVTFKLYTGSYQPFKTLNTKILYINNLSDYLPQIIKQLSTPSARGYVKLNHTNKISMQTKLTTKKGYNKVTIIINQNIKKIPRLITETKYRKQEIEKSFC